MSIGPPKRTRQRRVTAVELPPGMWKTLWSNLQRGAIILRLILCAVAALFLLIFTRSWDPPFNHRLGEIPQRNVVARVDFVQPDPVATKDARDKARQLTIAEFNQDPAPLVQLRGRLLSDINKLIAAESLEKADQALWKQFEPMRAPGTPDPTEEERREQFLHFREAFTTKGAPAEFEKKLADAMAEFEQHGLLE
jgi:hypothetical protein